MIDNNNILLVTNSDDIAKSISEKLILLRKNDCITVCSYGSVRKALKESLYCVIILHENKSNFETIKAIENIKSIKPDIEIMLLLDQQNPQLVLQAYDKGINDYFYAYTEDYEMLIKAVNCFKIRLIKDAQMRYEKILYRLGIIDTKTNFYQYKYFKEIFADISDNLRIQNGVLAILTLDSKAKTKVSTNRLSIAIRNGMRADDIASVAKGGKFYIILPNTDINNAKKFIDKIQDKMGEDLQIRAGLANVGIELFETLDKNVQDSLTSAIQNESRYECLDESLNNQNCWLCEDESLKTKKNFKLFKTMFEKQLNNVIIPLFFRYQKEFQAKIANSEISQYANDIESVFCIKNEKLRSELTIHYNGNTKYIIEITHSGLDSAENTKVEVSLKAMNNKLLTSFIKQLKNEHNESLAKIL